MQIKVTEYLDIDPNNLKKKDFNYLFTEMLESRYFNTTHIKMVNDLAPDYWDFFYSELMKESIETLFQKQKWYFNLVYGVGDLESISDKDRARLKNLFDELRKKYR